jgi:hypothetical protein
MIRNRVNSIGTWVFSSSSSFPLNFCVLELSFSENFPTDQLKVQTKRANYLIKSHDAEFESCRGSCCGLDNFGSRMHSLESRRENLIFVLLDPIYGTLAVLGSRLLG